MPSVILEGDCVEVMRTMDEASVDAIVCDPPYGLEFMGKEWDRLWSAPDNSFDVRPKGGASSFNRKRASYGTDTKAMQAWHEAWAREALRVLKPGGHMLAFSGTRTYHRLACAVEDAGFEIRDMVEYIYGSGFPKSLNVGKAIDKMAGAEREVIGRNTTANISLSSDHRNAQQGKRSRVYNEETGYDITAPATDEAKQWDGWGSGLKPSHEPIVLARKPLAESSIARQVLSTGTGAINVDASRIHSNGADDGVDRVRHNNSGTGNVEQWRTGKRESHTGSAGAGRFPANLIFSHHPDCRQVGERRVKSQSGANLRGLQHSGRHGGLADIGPNLKPNTNGERGYKDPHGMETVEAWECAPGCPVRELDRQSGTLKTGGASRFFYVAKASRRERNAGLEGMPEQSPWTSFDGQYAEGRNPKTGERTSTYKREQSNHHPTVKPIALMRYLCRLICPPGGTILDPFAGSGSTGCAAVLEGFDFIGIERESEYTEIARRRIDHWHAEAAEVLF